MQQYFAIDNWGLLIAVLMVCIAAGVSALMKLGVAKSLLWATRPARSCSCSPWASSSNM